MLDEEIIPYEIDRYFPFEVYRKHQPEIISKILKAFQTEKKYVILEAPTGIGKSVIAYTIGRYIIGNNPPEKIYEHKKIFGPPIMICTKTRQLQKQYISSFNDLKHIWSSKHYMCDLEPDDSDYFYFGSPLCMNHFCPELSYCKFLEARQRFNRSDIGILNYHYYLYSIYSHKFKPKLLVLDEAHNIENILCDLFALNINKNQADRIFTRAKQYRLFDASTSKLEKLIKDIINIEDIEDPDFTQNLKRYCDYLIYINDAATEEIKRIKSLGVNKIPDTHKELAIDLSKISTRCDELKEKLYRFIYREIDWVISDRNDNGIKLKPLEIGYLSDVLLKSADRFLFMSATICGFSQFCKELNIDESKSLFIEAPSMIPIKNRRVYSFNTGKMNYKNKKELMPKFINVMDMAITKIEDNKGSVRGIIHSVSYDNAKAVYESSKHKDRMILPNRLEIMDINDILETYDNTILVSPSILEGVDLKDDLSRFQIFLKVPYPFLGDRWIKAKMEKDKKWYARQAIMKLIQGSGRSTRTEDDWSMTVVLDSGLRVLINTYPELFSRWYKEAIKYVNLKT